MPSTSSTSKTWYTNVPLLTSFLFILPSILHYRQNDLFQAFCLFVFMVLRVGYQHPIRKHTYSTNSLLSLSHDLLSVVFLSLIHINAFYYGLIFRPDITYTLMFALALYKGIYLLLDISKDKRYSEWNIYMCLVLLFNLVTPNFGKRLSFGSFMKGFFWGWMLNHYKSRNVNNSVKDKIQKKIETYALLSRLHMAPCKPTKEPLDTPLDTPLDMPLDMPLDDIKEECDDELD